MSKASSEPVSLDDIFDGTQPITVKFGWKNREAIEVVPVITLHDKAGKLIDPESFVFFNQPDNEVATFRKNRRDESEFVLDLTKASGRVASIRVSMFSFYGNTKSNSWRYNIIQEGFHPTVEVTLAQGEYDEVELHFEKYPAPRVQVSQDSPEKVPANGKYSYPFLELLTIDRNAKHEWVINNRSGHGKSIDAAIDELFGGKLGEEDDD